MLLIGSDLFRLFLTTLIISMGPFICGISLGFSSSVSAQLLIGDNLIAFFSSIINLGALIGSLSVGPFLTSHGRRSTLRLSTIPSILGWLLISAAQGLSPPATTVEGHLVFSLILGRILTGLAAGMMTTVGSVYLVEVAPPHKSGLIGSMAQFGTVAGTCFMYYCGMILSWYETAELLVIISGVLLAATFYLPESPVWLAKQGQYQAAIRELTWLRDDEKTAIYELSEHSTTADPSSPDLEKAHASPSPVHSPPTTPPRRLLHLLWPCATVPPELRGRLRLALIFMVAQQTTGINVITFYTEPLCQRLVHVRQSAQCAFSLGLAQLLFSMAASMCLIDRAPRRKLIVATGALMAASMFFFAIGQKMTAAVPGLALAGFLLGFQCGWGPLALLVVTEITPSQHRGTVGSIAVSVSWITSFLITQTFHPLVRAFGGGIVNAPGTPATLGDAVKATDGVSGEVPVFLLYSAMTALATVYLYHHLPETNKAFQNPSAYAQGPVF